MSQSRLTRGWIRKGAPSTSAVARITQGAVTPDANPLFQRLAIRTGGEFVHTLTAVVSPALDTASVFGTTEILSERVALNTESAFAHTLTSVLHDSLATASTFVTAETLVAVTYLEAGVLTTASVFVVVSFGIVAESATVSTASGLQTVDPLVRQNVSAPRTDSVFTAHDLATRIEAVVFSTASALATNPPVHEDLSLSTLSYFGSTDVIVRRVVAEVRAFQTASRIQTLDRRFTPIPRVTFDGIPATDVQVVDGAITCRAPPHAPGSVDVHVVWDDREATTHGAYTYLGPIVLFDGVPATDVQVVDGAITCRAPPHAPGPVDVQVVWPCDPDITVTAEDGYTYVWCTTPCDSGDLYRRLLSVLRQERESPATPQGFARAYDQYCRELTRQTVRTDVGPLAAALVTAMEDSTTATGPRLARAWAQGVTVYWTLVRDDGNSQIAGEILTARTEIFEGVNLIMKDVRDSREEFARDLAEVLARATCRIVAALPQVTVFAAPQVITDSVFVTRETVELVEVAPPTGRSLISITVQPANPTIDGGADQQFTATGTYDDGMTDDLTEVAWTSADPSVATIDPTGLAHAVTGASGGGTASAITENSPESYARSGKKAEFFSVTVQAAANVVIATRSTTDTAWPSQSTDPYGIDSAVHLYDSQGNELAQNDDAGADQYWSLVHYRLQPGMQYYVEVMSWYDPFQFTLYVTSAEAVSVTAIPKPF